MGIDLNSMLLKRMSQMKAIQKTQATGATQSQNVGSASSGGGGSLMDRLNGLDNQLNQGGGVSLPDSSTNQVNAMDMKKKKLM